MYLASSRYLSRIGISELSFFILEAILKGLRLGYESPEAAKGRNLTEQCLYQLELLLAQQTSPGETAAIILEPVLGEGGYVPAPKEFLEGLRAICDREKMLLIMDEVQSGFGRTGTCKSSSLL